MDTFKQARCSDGHPEVTFTVREHESVTCPICTLRDDVNRLQMELDCLRSAVQDTLRAAVEAELSSYDGWIREQVQQACGDVMHAAKIIREADAVERSLDKMNREEQS